MTTSRHRRSAGYRNLRRAARLLAFCVVWAGASAQAPPADRDDGEALANLKRCNACHALDEALLGPPYRAIAARHASDRELKVEALARKIIHGGAGNWGVVPMVPNEHVSLEEAREIAAWILSLND
jgi:cytochrome c